MRRPNANDRNVAPSCRSIFRHVAAASNRLDAAPKFGQRASQLLGVFFHATLHVRKAAHSQHGDAQDAPPLLDDVGGVRAPDVSPLFPPGVELLARSMFHKLACSRARALPILSRTGTGIAGFGSAVELGAGLVPIAPLAATRRRQRLINLNETLTLAPEGRRRGTTAARNSTIILYRTRVERLP